MPDEPSLTSNFAGWEPFHRYRVTICGFGAERWDYPVTTRYGPHKAVGLATAAFLFERNIRAHFRTIELVDLGEGQDGNDIGDPTEF